MPAEVEVLRSIVMYIDPGTGAFVWQMLAAGGIGVLFFLRRVRERVVAWFTRGDG